VVANRRRELDFSSRGPDARDEYLKR